MREPRDAADDDDREDQRAADVQPDRDCAIRGAARRRRRRDGGIDVRGRGAYRGHAAFSHTGSPLPGARFGRMPRMNALLVAATLALVATSAAAQVTITDAWIRGTV